MALGEACKCKLTIGRHAGFSACICPTVTAAKGTPRSHKSPGTVGRRELPIRTPYCELCYVCRQLLMRIWRGGSCAAATNSRKILHLNALPPHVIEVSVLQVLNYHTSDRLFAHRQLLKTCRTAFRLPPTPGGDLGLSDGRLFGALVPGSSDACRHQPPKQDHGYGC